MTKDDVNQRILEIEDRVHPARNVCGIFTAALYGLFGCPVCCCFCCGCNGKFPAGPLVPVEAELELPRDARTVFNIETHILATVLGCSPVSWCTACMCCGSCGKYGPYGTAKRCVK